MHIVLIEPDSNFRDLIDLNISKLIDVDSFNIVSFGDTAQAWGIIEILDDVVLVICKDNFEDYHSIKFISESIIKNGFNIPILSIGSDIGEALNILKTIPENAPPTDIAKVVYDILEDKKIDDDSKKKEEMLKNKRYKSVPINLFKYFNKVPFDFYIRIKKIDDYQFIKRINKDESYDMKMIDSYSEKKLTHFFIDKEDYQDFTSIVNKRFQGLLGSEKLNNKSKEEIRKYVLIQLSSTGFSESNLDLALKSINDQSEKFEKDTSKLNLLSKVYHSQLGFRFQRNYMISIVGSLIVEASDWADSKHTGYINIAAYIHDMFLESEEEMDISSDHELEQSIDDKSQKERIYNHAILSADKVKAIDRIPADVVTIVRQHHGKDSGKGYSTDFSPSIKKLSILFIVAEEVAIAILKSPRKQINLRGIFNEINKKYNNDPNVSKCLDALNKSLESTK